MSQVPDRVTIVEVGPRDGLQNESVPIPTAAKIEFIRALADAGCRHIEATSFVHPSAIPQLADAAELLSSLPPLPGVTLSTLVPNQKGLERAIAAGVQRIAVFTAASESFTQKNIRMTIAESLDAFRPIVHSAKSAGMTVRGYVSTCFVCPFEGDVSEEKVYAVTKQLLDMGVDEVAISDTIGAAAPTDIRRVLNRLIREIPARNLALHLHDTYGTALANASAGLDMGITTFDASTGGLGGCPYAPGASGNLATEDLVYMLERMGIQTGLSIPKLVAAADSVARLLNRSLPSHQWQRLRGKCN